MSDVRPRSPQAAVEAALSEHEELVHDTPVERYLAVLTRWEALSRRQAAYEKELRTLKAEGDTLAAAWTALQEELREAEAGLTAAALAPAAMLQAAYRHWKAQLAVTVQQCHKPSMAVFVPREIQTLAQPLTLNPRGQA